MKHRDYCCMEQRMIDQEMSMSHERDYTTGDAKSNIHGYAHIDGEIDALPGSAAEIAQQEAVRKGGGYAPEGYSEHEHKRAIYSALYARDKTVVKDRTKARFDLIPYGPLWKMAEVFTTGARKPGRIAHNWRNGTNWSDYFSAMMRHASLYQQGEDFEIDPDTGDRIDHLAAVMCCASILLEYQMFSLGTDDRFPAGHPAYKGEKT